MTPAEWGTQIAFGVRSQVKATETAGVLPGPAFLMMKGNEQRSMVLTEDHDDDDLITRLRSLVAAHDPEMVALCLLFVPPEDEPRDYLFVASIQAKEEPREFHIEVIQLTTDPEAPEPDDQRILEAIGPHDLYDPTGLSAAQLQWGHRALEQFVEIVMPQTAVN